MHRKQPTWERTVVGRSGAVLVGSRRAADLGAWRLVLAIVDPPTYRVEAAVLRSSVYWLTQRPWTVALAVGDRTWAWTVADARIDGGTLIGTVTGKPERR